MDLLVRDRLQLHYHWIMLIHIVISNSEHPTIPLPLALILPSIYLKKEKTQSEKKLACNAVMSFILN